MDDTQNQTQTPVDPGTPVEPPVTEPQGEEVPVEVPGVPTPAETPEPTGEAPAAPTYEEPAAAEPTPVPPAEGGEESSGPADTSGQPV